jgi:hypothetical protein
MLDIQVTGLEPEKRLRALIAGNQGAGKTLLSSTFPKPFIASCEGGMLSLSSRRVPFHEVANGKEMDDIIQGLKQPPEIREKIFGGPVETLVIDTIDAFQKTLKKQRMIEKRQDNFQMQDWGWLGEQLRSYMRAWMSLDLNLVVTSHLGSETDEELGRIYHWPALEGGFKKEIPNSFDICGVLNARGKTEIQNGQNVKVIERRLQLFPEVNTPWLKDRSGKLPLEFPVTLHDDYDRMAELIFADWDANKAQADEELEALRKRAKANAEDIVELLDEHPEPKLKDIETPSVVETISSDQFQELTAPFGDIADSTNRKKAKDQFVGTFGNPMKLPADKLEEATQWIQNAVKTIAEANSAPEVEATPQEPAPSQENPAAVLASPASDEVSSDPAPEEVECTDCGVVIDDPDVVELSTMQFEAPYCAEDFKKKAKG